LILAALGWGAYQARSYAYRTPRLAVRSMMVSGLVRVSENDVLRRVGHTSGLSLFEVNLDEVRQGVEEIAWVQHATIQRVWPNEIVISVVERSPVALARIDGEIYQVDNEGVVLPPDSLIGTSFPILDGLLSDDAEGNQRKIGIYKDTIETIGEQELSEVHVQDSGDVSVVPSNSPILVELGSSDLRVRWDRYVRLRARIREDYPSASRVDLRFQGQIVIQTRESQPAGRILWGDEKKLL
jgi:cell division protein FtsQ